MRIRRRDFITLIGGAAAWPLAARAQQPGLPVIGYLYTGYGDGTDSLFPSFSAAFRKGLSEAGYDEGRNVAIEYRFAKNELDRFPELAADLVRRRVDIIVTPGGMSAARAAKAATAAIPIVFSFGGDPIQLGLVPSLARPGGNMTGVTSMGGELAGKQLGFIHVLLPGARRVAILQNPNSLNADSVLADARLAASSMGLQIEVLSADTDRAIDMAFDQMAKLRADAFLVGTNTLFADRRARLVALAARYALPAIYFSREHVKAGGLMSYASDLLDRERQVGVYAGRILKGEKPADLPVMRAVKFDLVINLQTAKALGLTVPPSLLAIADEVIE